MPPFALLRSGLRVLAGRRPHQRDLDRLVERLRARLLAGRAPKVPARFPLPQDFVLRRLRGLQLRKLRRTIDQARRWVPHYREAFGDLTPPRALSELARYPITRREDLEREPSAFISRAPGLTASVPMGTTGTTGRKIPLWLTPEEFDYYASVQALGGMLAGFLGPSRVLQISVPLENSITARIVAEAAQRSGALVLIPALGGSLDDHLDSLLCERDVPGKSAKVTNLLCAPAFLWALTARAEQTGRDLSKAELDNVFCFGAKTTPQLRRRVREAWGVDMKEGYSLTETPGTGAIECEQGRLHFLDASGVLEVVDPDSGRPLPPGETGMALITTLVPDRELQPMIRYCTGDLVRVSPDTRCDCGRPSTLLEEIEGRIDQVMIIGAVNVHPQSIGDELVAFGELVQPPRYALAISQGAVRERLLVEVETAQPLSRERAAEIERRLRASVHALSSQHEAVGAVESELRFVPEGSIAEPFPFKLVGPAPR